MKIRFIAPSWADHEGRKRVPKSLFPPLNLAVLAALTPDSWEVDIVDESIEPLHFDDPVDVAAITALTAVAPRAYQIADEYRRRGVKVVLGGMHASALPDEAGQHADAVVVGEAEPAWRDVLADARRGRLKPRYHGRPGPLDGLPVPRRDLFRRDRYLFANTMQSSRGCPHNCSFCTVTRFFGRTYRTRPIPDVLREIESMPGKNLLIVDDNIIGDVARAKQLFAALAGHRLRWVGQSSLDIARDPTLLRLAARSGCAALFIGFESLIAENLRRIGKSVVNRVEGFLDAVRRIQAHGIDIQGAFIFGLDGDDPGIFKRTVDFARRAHLAAVQFGILTPFPGTRLRRQLEAAGRIITSDWSQYTISNAVFQPLHMTRERLRQGYTWAYREFYSYRSMLHRLLPRAGRNLPLLLYVNLSFRRGIGRRLAHCGADPLPSPFI